MNKVDKQDLRVLAQSATPGTWDIDYPDDGFNSDDALIQRDTVGMLPICVVEGAHPESGFDEDFQKEQQANARYIAAANPPTILALLDENEALEKRVVELAVENADLKHPGTYLPSKIDTPATDAFINEMQAQGVERCAAWIQGGCKYSRMAEMLREFAAKLREGKA